MRRTRFGRMPRPGGTKPAIREEQKLCPYKKQKCSGCSVPIAAGEDALRFVLSKRHRGPCATCGNEPKRSRWYHPHCRPLDINKAMGYDPTHVNPTAYVPPSHTVPPPPAPKTTTELKVESVLAFEAALAAGIRDRSVARTTELADALGKLTNIKARILRPGTPGEGDAAVNVALKKLIDLVFAGR